MPHTTAPAAAGTWARFAAVPQRQFSRSLYSTVLMPCGIHWDAVAIDLEHGLRALDEMRLPVDRGHMILADYLRRLLYVLVAPGTGHLCRIGHARVLVQDSWLLMPATVSHPGSVSATWLCPPVDWQVMVDARDLRIALQPRHAATW